MNFADFILDFSAELINSYRKFFKRTYSIALIFSLFTVIGICILLLLDSSNDFESIKKKYFLDALF